MINLPVVDFRSQQREMPLQKRVTRQQLIGDIKHTWKNILFFHVCCYDFSQGWKSLYNIVVYMIKTK